MVLSWKLWRGLHYPPSTQFFSRRVVVAKSPPIFGFLQATIDTRWWRVLGLLALAFVVFRWGITSVLMIFFVLPGVLILAFIILPLLLPLVTTIVGGYWSASVSHAILYERNARTYDLLCMGPNGTLGANWAIAGSCLAKHGLFTNLYYGTIASIILGGLGVVLMVAVFGLLVVSGATVDELIPAVRTLFELFVLLGVFWLHYVHSVVLSVLVGLFVPTYMGHDAPWVAFGFYQAVQVIVYGLFALIFHLLSPLTAAISPDLWWAYLSVPFFYLLLLALLREALLVWLWGVVSSRLNADFNERNVLLQSLSS